MPKLVKPLSETQCNKSKAREKDYSISDGNCLRLLIRKSNNKVWQYKYTQASGKDAIITIGRYPEISLKQAREIRTQIYLLREKNLTNWQITSIIKNKGSLSFEEVARKWHTRYTSTGRWAEETSKNALKNFEKYAFPIIGNIPINQIKLSDLLAVLKSIENQGYAEVLKKMRQRFKLIFGYAIAENLIERNPTFEIDTVKFIASKSKNLPCLELNEIPTFLQKFRKDTGSVLTHLCLEFGLHTFVRSSELRFARWNEFDLENKLWTIPATRDCIPGYKNSSRGAKMKTKHLVPLSAYAIELLHKIRLVSDSPTNLFPKNSDISGFISENSINKLIRRLGYDTQNDICHHGFRSFAEAAIGESNMFDREAVELQMSHSPVDTVRGAYTSKLRYLEVRRKMLNWWSQYLVQLEKEFMLPDQFSERFHDSNLVKHKPF